jgi:predicted HicB family RNase H-like nuclease
MIEYKGFKGSYTFNEDTGLFQGKVVNIKDLITFEGKSIESTHKAFCKAVDTYMVWCARYGKEGMKILLAKEDYDT